MNKKYKCIKSYPTGPEVGSILEPLNNYYTCNNKNYCAGEWNYSEFFEEVKEKEYQILKIKTNSTRISDCVEYGVEYLTALLKTDSTSIHSIKRLSDNEVFQIGDIVKYYGNITKIESFYFNEHNQLSFKVEECNTSLTGCFPSVHLEKYKEPIYVTADGYEVMDYETRTYWIHNISCTTIYPTILSEIWFEDKHLEVRNQYTIFKDSNKAEEFRKKELAKKKEEQMLDKPLLSLKEVYNIIDNTLLYCDQKIKLKELVKSKM